MSGRHVLSKKLVKLAEIDAARVQERCDTLEQEVRQARTRLQALEEELSRFEASKEERSGQGLKMGELKLFEAHAEGLIRSIGEERESLTQRERDLSNEKNRLIAVRRDVDRAEKVSLRVRKGDEKKRAQESQRVDDDRASRSRQETP